MLCSVDHCLATWLLINLFFVCLFVWVCTWADLQNFQEGAAPPHQTETRWTEKEQFLSLSSPLGKAPHFGILLCWMGLARYSRNYSGWYLMQMFKWMKTVWDLGILQQAFVCLCIPRRLDRLWIYVIKFQCLTRVAQLMIQLSHQELLAIQFLHQEILVHLKHQRLPVIHQYTPA